MSDLNASNPLAERELELSLWEAELNRREEALRRFEGFDAALSDGMHGRIPGLERRERELQRAIEAVESQRVQLEAVRTEYESRRDALRARTLEVEAELDRLRAQIADRTRASLEQPNRLGTPLEAA